MQDAETLWADFARPIATADDYIASLRGRAAFIGQHESNCRSAENSGFQDKSPIGDLIKSAEVALLNFTRCDN